MQISTTVRNVGSALLAATLLTGCSSIADKATDKVVEKGIEKGAEAAGGSDVDIDTDGDGKLKIESDEGSMEFSGGGELPEGFPEEVPLPEGFEIASSMSLGTKGSEMFTLLMTSSDANVKATFDDLKTRAEAAGFEITSNNSMSGDSYTIRSMTMGNDAWNSSVTVTEDSGTTSVTYTVTTPDE